MLNTSVNPIQDALRSVHLAGVVVCVLILGGAAALGVVPAVRAHDSDQALRSDLTAVANELDQAGDAHMSLLARVDALRETVRARDVDLTHADDVNRLMAVLTSDFESMGLSLLTLQPGSIEPASQGSGTDTASMPIQFSVEGALERVIGMLERLRDDHPDLHVVAFTIEHASPGTVRLRASVRWLVAPGEKDQEN